MAEERQREPVECVISVDGTEIADLYPYLREVQVSMSRRAATTATITFDSVRLEDGRWSVQDAGVLEAWKRITIEAAFGNETEEVMRGYIKEVRCEYPEDMSAARVTVNAQDESLMLDREHVRGPLSTEDAPMTDGDIVSDIATDHSLDASTEPGLTNAALNIDGTYVRLLNDRAEANGFEFYVREGTLYFHPPRLDQDPVPEPIRIYAGAATNCLRFSAQYDGHKPDIVAVMRAAESGTEAEEGRYESDMDPLGPVPATSASRGLEPFVWRMQAPSGATADEVHSRAQAKANENAWKITAEGELDGALYGHVLLTHKLVVVDGAGETYGGTYYVDEVQHRFSMEGYREGFKLLRNATGEDGTVGLPNPLESLFA
jgi:phage protein D